MLTITHLANKYKNMDLDQISNPREALKDLVKKLSNIRIDYDNLSNDEIIELFNTTDYASFSHIYKTYYGFSHKIVYIDKFFTNKNTNNIIYHKEKIELLLSNSYYFLEKYHPFRILLNQHLTPYIESTLKIVLDYYINMKSLYRLETELIDKSDTYNFNKQTLIFVLNHIESKQKEIPNNDFNKEIDKIINIINKLV